MVRAVRVQAFIGVVLLGILIIIFEFDVSITLPSVRKVTRILTHPRNVATDTREIITDKPRIQSLTDSTEHRDPIQTTVYEIRPGTTPNTIKSPPTTHSSTIQTTTDKESPTNPPTSLDNGLPSHLKQRRSVFDVLSKSVHHLVPRPSPLEGYLEVPNADMASHGDIELAVYRYPGEATHRCNYLGAACKAFVASAASYDEQHYYMKGAFSFPISSAGLNLYIKEEFVGEYLTVLKENTRGCAIPISQLNQTHTRCKLPVLDPFEPSVMKHIIKQKPAQCDGRLYTRFENGVLSLTEDAQELGVQKVDFQPILRPPNSDFDYTLGNGGTLSANKTRAKVDNDFLLVKVHFKNGHIQTDLHASVVEKQQVRMRHQRKDAPLDIMIVAFDSLSTAHFQRMLPQTFQFLKNDLKSDIFQGFSIVGEATTPALTAMLTGVSLQENCDRQEGRRGHPNAQPLDRWPFVFKEFNEKGFATMWSEDDPEIGTFNLRLLGFTNPPVDHYARNFWYYPPKYMLCHGSQIQFMLQLNYLKSFMSSYKDVRKFGFTFLSDLCHQSYSHVGIADTHVAAFVKSLRDEGLLDNTMLVVMGDHGPRFGGVRETVQGKLEETLPFLSISLPQWFKAKFPQELNHFHGNTGVLISPFDLHATFLHLMSFPRDHEQNTNGRHGISLFQRISQSRSCFQAQVPSHFCPCIDHRNITTLHAHVQKGANAVVQEINRRLKTDPAVSSKCSNVTLQEIVNAAQSMPGKDLQLFDSIPGGAGLGIGKVQSRDSHFTIECDYQIQIITSPGGSRFESSFRVVRGDYHVSKNIIRINAYGDQPRCISKTHPYLRDYCICL